ncbi:MAG: HAD hydrolase-like protein [Treponemataceae bacterium]|nr:HAD hydrolase-like protein [Treponemataceae bacterium]
MQLDNFKFSQIYAVIFNLDGTLYDNNELYLRLLLRDPFHIKYTKAEIICRKKFSGKDFGNSKNFYKSFFAEASKLARTSVEKFEKWYFTTFMPNCCNILKDYYYKRDSVEELFTQLRRSEIPFAIFSDYCFINEKMKSIGFENPKNFTTYSAEEMGCQKPCTRFFTTMAENLLSKNYPDKGILVIGDIADKDYEGAKNARLDFIQIENSNNEGNPEPKEFIKCSWGKFSMSYTKYLREELGKSKSIY